MIRFVRCKEDTVKESMRGRPPKPKPETPPGPPKKRGRPPKDKETK